MRWGADDLLVLWEQALAYSGTDRGAALVDAAVGTPQATRTVGRQNIQLLQIHANLFGANVALLSNCPGCATGTQFTVDCNALVQSIESSVAHDVSSQSSYQLESDGHVVQFHLPTITDVAIAAQSADEC